MIGTYGGNRHGRRLLILAPEVLSPRHRMDLLAMCENLSVSAVIIPPHFGVSGPRVKEPQVITNTTWFPNGMRDTFMPRLTAHERANPNQPFYAAVAGRKKRR